MFKFGNSFVSGSTRFKVVGLNPPRTPIMIRRLALAGTVFSTCSVSPKDMNPVITIYDFFTFYHSYSEIGSKLYYIYFLNFCQVVEFFCLWLIRIMSEEVIKKRFLSVFIIMAALVIGLFDAPLYFNKGVDFLMARTNLPDFEIIKIRPPLYQPFRLGLDLIGGTHLVYEADLSNVSTVEKGNSMSALRDVIERRVNLFGVNEPIVQVERQGDSHRLIVELAGIKDINEAIRLIGDTPFLEFRESRPEEERNKILEAQKSGEKKDIDAYFIPTTLNGKYLKKSVVDFDQTTYRPVINLQFNDEGAKLFEEITERNIGKPVGIYLDGYPISAPNVREKISGGNAQITGSFTPDEAKKLVGRLNSGALPVPIKIISQQSVEASLGEVSLAKSLTAALYGFLAVAVFMIIWYRLPGVVSVFALFIYITLVLAFFKIVPVTLTAAGIAGFVLSLGMAVDANILIFERFKEELRRGKNMENSFKEGFSRAWTSIRDSNVSSIITALILYWFGTSLVKGFALTLGIGVLVSMFSAITVSRTFLYALMSPRMSKWRLLFLSGISK